MGQPAAKDGDIITATDIHNELVPNPPNVVLTPLPHQFNGIINDNLSSNVFIMGKPAATVGSTAENTPPHIPLTGVFQTQPSNKATIESGSSTVFINGKPAARGGDSALTCNDPFDRPVGVILATGTVLIG